MKKADFIIIAAVVAVFLVYLFFPADGQTVSIWSDGKLYAEKNIDKDCYLNIKTQYGSNVVVIENKCVYMAEADCPDKLCMHSKIKKAGQSIVCLPGRISIMINGKSETDVIVR